MTISERIDTFHLLRRLNEEAYNVRRDHARAPESNLQTATDGFLVANDALTKQVKAFLDSNPVTT